MQSTIEEMSYSEVHYYSLQSDSYKQIPEHEFDSEKMKAIGFYFDTKGNKIYFVLNIEL